MARQAPWNREALKITAVYLLVGALWIFFSDLAVEKLAADFSFQSQLQTYKGWFYVLATAFLLFFLIRRGLAAVAAAEARGHEERRALEESRNTHARLFETMAHGAVYLTPDGEIIEANPMAERIVGMTSEQMRGRKSDDTVWRIVRENGEESPVDEHPALVAGRTGRSVGKVVMGFHNATLDETRWIEIHAVPEFRPGQARPFQVLTTFDDITDRKRLEEERDRLTRQRLLALHAARLGWWHFDPRTEIVSFDERYREITGVEGLEEQRAEIMERVHPEDRPGVLTAMAGALDPEDPRPYAVQCRMNRPDGGQRWVEAFGLADFSGVGPDREAVAFVGTVADITQRKESEIRRQLMIDLLNLLSGAEDTRETLAAVLGYLKRWSGCEAVGIRLKEGKEFPYYETAGGAEPILLQGKKLCRYDQDRQVMQDAEDCPPMDCLCGNIIAGLHDSFGSHLTKDGCFWSNNNTDLLWTTGEGQGKEGAGIRCQGFGYESVALIPLRAGNETFGLIQFNDSREGMFNPDLIAQFRWAADNLAQFLGRRQAEDENTRLGTQLNQAMRLEAVGRLAGGVAHDFNNLLTTVIGNASLSLLDLDEGDPMHDNLVQIQRAGERGARLTGQLLAFSRKQVMEPLVVDINKILRGLEDMFRTLLGEDIDVRWFLSEEDCRAKVDSGQIEQVITNLCVNARDAMPEGGKLTIETAIRDLGPDFNREHRNMNPGRYVMVAVSDSGEGMDPETQSRIFEPFFTTKAENQGTGLGLSTSFGIIKQHGGHIELYSEPGLGSTFKIYLPLVDAPASAVPAESSREEVARCHETILVVEDDEGVREVAVRILRPLGYMVIEAVDAEEALKRAAANRGRIDLLMTDVVLPGMNGRRLAEKLQASHPDLKVLFASGYTQDVIARQGILEDGIQFVGKPYSPKTLALKVRQALAD